jgi:alpha-glucoside transport system permease protein
MFGMPLVIYLLHNFVATLPKELMEAARVDGANHFEVFRRIVLPLSLPAVASIAIFQFLWIWNDLLVALVFAGGTDDVAPLTLHLANLGGSLGSHWENVAPAALISIIIPLIVFFSLQRYFVRGLLAGSVKS